MSSLARFRFVLVLGLLFAAPISVATTAHAQEEPAPDFDSLLDRGMQHYQAREYEQAIELFRAAFAVRPEPEIVYNIARSYERLAQPEQAIAEYERFVGLPGTTSELRGRAHASIRSLRAELAASQSEATTPETTSTPPSDSGAASTEAPPPPPPASASVLGPVGWSLLGVGAAAAGVGIGFGVMTMDRNAAFERATLRSEQEHLRDEVRRDALVADVLMIGGGVIAATGIVLLIVDATSGSGESEASTAEPAIAVLPYAGPSGAGLTASGTF